jgi:ubiquinone/menaquinone biosynthesis C-methylase UbiE
MAARDEEIFEFWSRQAEEHGDAPDASWSDRRVIELEIEAIHGRIPSGTQVVDVGCANGFSSVRYAAVEGVRLLGLDYVPARIDAANRRRATLPPDQADRVEFRVGDARALDLDDGWADCLISTRVLINLGDWSGQQRGLDEYARVLAPNGLLLLSEATVGGWQRLNDLRAEFALSPIPMPAFNTYLDEERVIEQLAPQLELVELVDFASSYYVATRVVKPILAAATGRTQEYVVDPATEFNRLAAQLPPAGDYGVQKLFVFRKQS